MLLNETQVPEFTKRHLTDLCISYSALILCGDKRCSLPVGIHVGFDHIQTAI